MTKHFSQLSRSIRDKVAIVTGAASGMGRATAQLFADEGARLAIFDLNSDALDEVEQEIRGNGAEVLAISVDLSSRSNVEQAVHKAAEHFSAIDILVNNAGVATIADIEDEQFEGVWDHSLAVMISAQAWAIRAALPSLRKSGSPRIVNVASTEAFGATPHQSAYTVAKHASLGLTRSLAVELGPEGITVNCVCPGPIKTAMTAHIPEEHKTIFAKRRTALRRYGDPEEVAHAILGLVIPAASYITGIALPADGGLLIRNA